MCIAALSLLVLILLLPLHRIGGYDVESDFYGRYLPEARALLSGRPTSFPFSGPGYPLFVAGIGSLVGDSFRGAQLLSAASAALASLAAYVLGSRVASPRVGLWLQGLVLLGSARFAILASTELFFLAITTAGLALLLRLPAPTPAGFLAAGALAGWATLTRYNGIYLLLFGIVLAVCRPFSTMSARSRILGLLSLGLGFLASSGWWWILNTRWNGSPFAGKVFLIAATVLHGRGLGDMEDLASVEPKYDGLAAVLLDDLPGNLATVLGNLGVRLLDLAIGVVQPPAALFLPWGVASLRASPSNRRLVLAFVLGLLPLCLAPRGTRYLVPLLPIAYAYSALGLARLVDGDPPAERLGRRIRRAIAVSVPILLAVTSAWKIHQYVSTEPRELLVAAEALREAGAGRDALVVARKPHLPAVASTRGGWPRDFHDLATFAERVEGMGAEFLFVGERETMVAPFLDPLRDGAWASEDWKLIRREPSARWSLYKRAPD